MSGLGQELGVVGLEPERDRDRVQHEDGLARLVGRVVHRVVPGRHARRQHARLPDLGEEVEELPHLRLVVGEDYALALVVGEARPVTLHHVFPNLGVGLVAQRDAEPVRPRRLLRLLRVRQHVRPGRRRWLQPSLFEQVLAGDQHEALEAVHDVVNPPVGLQHDLGRIADPSTVRLLQFLVEVGDVE